MVLFSQKQSRDHGEAVLRGRRPRDGAFCGRDTQELQLQQAEANVRRSPELQTRPLPGKFQAQAQDKLWVSG